MELYFDTASTTPLTDEVKRTISDAMNTYGNPSSLHRLGILAEETVSDARRRVQKALGFSRGNVIFTGSGTEANNLAIFGYLDRHLGKGRHAVTTEVEHPSVLEAFRRAERLGMRVTYISPDGDGRVPPDRIIGALSVDTVLVSMMHVNNETGAIMPVDEIAHALMGNRKIVFHVDGIQAFGKLASVLPGRIDMYSVSGHKIGAPKGVGALYIREGLSLAPILYGGGQEQGLRSGTENVLGIAALGTAAENAAGGVSARYAHVKTLCNFLLDGLSGIDGCQVHRAVGASPYIVNATFSGLRGEVLVHAFEQEGLFVSTGSACSSRGRHVQMSHVLQAMGKNPDLIQGAVRFSLGYWHTEEDVRSAIDIVKRKVTWLYSVT